MCKSISVCYADCDLRASYDICEPGVFSFNCAAFTAFRRKVWHPRLPNLIVNHQPSNPPPPLPTANLHEFWISLFIVVKPSYIFTPSPPPHTQAPVKGYSICPLLPYINKKCSLARPPPMSRGWMKYTMTKQQLNLSLMVSLVIDKSFCIRFPVHRPHIYPPSINLCYDPWNSNNWPNFL